MIKFLDLEKQYLSIQQAVDSAIRAVIDEQAFIGGKYAARFEEEFAAFIGANHCVGVANGTDAIEIALEALSLPAGSEVIVPANTFIATAEAVTRTGHRVVFCDCDPESYTISVDDLRAKITPRTSAVIPVHLYGHPCDMAGVLDVAREFGLRIVEDCAQAHGAEYREQRVGTFGDAATFSFYPGKNLGAYGDAGAIVCRDEELARRCRMIANHGRVDKYDHVFEGRNSRLDGLQAAILSAKLPHLEAWTEARRSVAAEYRRLLSDLPDIVLPMEQSGCRHVYHLFVVRTPYREELRSALKARGIETGVHYPIALPDLQAYADHPGRTGEYLASRFSTEVLSLPIGDHLGPDNVQAVADGVRVALREIPATLQML